MHDVMLWVGFLGTWLLVAGPVYQAVLELQSEELEADRIRALTTRVPRPPEVSMWWWLLPPVRYVLERRRSRSYRELIVSAMTDAEFEAMTNFINKSTGWLLVALGGFLIATEATYSLTDGNDWPVGVFWALLVVMPALSIGFSVAREHQSELHARHRRRPAGDQGS